MSRKRVDLSTLRFLPLSTVKAKLSEEVRELRPGERRVVITVAGRPAAVLVAFDEFVEGIRVEPTEVITIEEWRGGRAERERIRGSVLSLFDTGALSRKGQKRYKREAVRALRR